ncbi:MAG: FAD:protein FMN transferase [Solirubrobacteraceae bacterium]
MPTEVVTDTWPALGTTAVICGKADCLAEIRRAVQREIDAIDRAASRFAPDSELSRVNHAQGRRLRISARLLEALRLAVRAAVITGGAVDPTLGESLIEVGYDRDWDQLPHVAAGAPLDRRRGVHAVRRGALWRSVQLWDDPPAVRLPPGVQLDLGATAKALAADHGARAGHLAGGQGVLVSLGGDIATAGPAPARGWLVRVTDDHRNADADAGGQTVTISSGGLATSSLVPRRWYHDGQAMHHILDPETGQPVEPWWRTASVAAASCAEANIASTAALVMGQRAPDWLAAQELPARLTAVSGAVKILGGWPA